MGWRKRQANGSKATGQLAWSTQASSKNSRDLCKASYDQDIYYSWANMYMWNNWLVWTVEARSQPWYHSLGTIQLGSFFFILCVCFACLPVCVSCACLLDALELCLWMIVDHHTCARAPSTLKCWTSCPGPTLVLETGALPGSGACQSVRLARDLQWPWISISPVIRL